MKFLIDMNLGPLWVSFLEDRGFEAVHWSTVGGPAASDREIFDFAADAGWIVLHPRSRFRSAAGSPRDT
jgi:predicted nuclease of predicted toxin-antitoxin system